MNSYKNKTITMSKANLLPENYVTSKGVPGKKIYQNEKMKPSISNSFIKNQTAQMKNAGHIEGIKY